MVTKVKYRIGVDVGGTFTDLVFNGDDGSLLTRKVPTTPDDYGRGIVSGIQATMASSKIAPESIEVVIHATTVATNTILEIRGAKTALVTTKGFRDILEMRRLRIPEMYVLNYKKASPLVPRNLSFEVDERLDSTGKVLTTPSSQSIAALIESLRANKVEAVAICLINSYVNRAHEDIVASALREALSKETFITCSSDILPEIREYERASTTVINAYLGPVLNRYFESLVRNLRSIGVAAPVRVMKSDGGIMSVAQAAIKPAYIVESGPSAGVIGAADLTRQAMLPDMITLDMGGTTAKASIVEAGKVSKSGDYEVGAGINLSSRLVMGGGHALKLPVIDISEIGAGGGSLVSIDRSGALAVGPRSAGASPGPVAYDAGGTEPTLTDAMILLGYINPEYLVGGELKLNRSKAESVMQDMVAVPMNRSLMETAYGVFQVSAGTMVRAVKAVSTYRGRDPRDFALFGFGGNGPVLATEIADALDMTRVVIPLNPGVFSAVGLLKSAVEQELTQAYVRVLAQVKDDSLDQALEGLKRRLLELMVKEGCEVDQVILGAYADLRYYGQAHELTVKVAFDSGGKFDVAGTAEAFGVEHERTYGHRTDASEVQCVNLRLIGSMPSKDMPIDVEAALSRPSATPPNTTREVYYGPKLGVQSTPIIRRADLRGIERAGPIIVEEYDTTCVIPPGWIASVDAFGNILLDRSRVKSSAKDKE